MIRDTIKHNLIPSKNFIFGFADLRGLIASKFDGFHYGISIGKKLQDEIIDRLENGPTIEYYNY